MPWSPTSMRESPLSALKSGLSTRPKLLQPKAANQCQLEALLRSTTMDFSMSTVAPWLPAQWEFEHGAAGNSSQHSSPPHLMDGTPRQLNADSMSLRTRGKVVTRNSGENVDSCQHGRTSLWDPETKVFRLGIQGRNSQAGQGVNAGTRRKSNVRE
mgnify:CR=1 FL=1